jgi:hypothetical protein
MRPGFDIVIVRTSPVSVIVRKLATGRSYRSATPSGASGVHRRPVASLAMTSRPTNPLDDLARSCTETVAPIQPYQARKAYACPGCSTEIAVGTGHLVVVPDDAPDLRRHWHRGCWHKERRRRGDHASVHPS